MNCRKLFICALTLLITTVCSQARTRQVLDPEDFRHYVEYFNRMEDENIVQAIPNDKSWEWMEENIPFFACPQDNFEEMWYFRWWSFRKGIQATPDGYVINEFLVNRTYADKYNMIACAIGHHINEARWLHDSRYIDEYLHIWYRGNQGQPMNRLHKFSSWTPYALYNRYLVNRDADWILDMLPDLDRDYLYWENAQRWENGLYWQGDVQDGMEESISGGRKIKNARPTINSYMYGNAVALCKLYRLQAERTSDENIKAASLKKADEYRARATRLRTLIQKHLWNTNQQFYETRRVKDNQLANVREAIGYMPWYVEMPDGNILLKKSALNDTLSTRDYEIAWKQVLVEKGFLAPYGLTTAERRHPQFRTHGVGQCEWDGAVWPFATSQTLTAMANVLNDYRQEYVTKADYYRLMNLYVESQYKRGRPYIGEYLDETTGYWIKGDQERSRYYNHSTFADLIITGLIGLRPRPDESIEINPLIPEEVWDWYCLDNVHYNGHTITILWDKDGSHFKKGAGFQVFIDGKRRLKATHPNHFTL